MEENAKGNEEVTANSANHNEIYSQSFRSGKRTYFFDVKSTRQDELYLTITESKKRYSPDGGFQYEKHKIFLYREDFESFAEMLDELRDYIANNQVAIHEEPEEVIEVEEKDFVDLKFEDLSSI
jgi:hypothetical protein